MAKPFLLPETPVSSLAEYRAAGGGEGYARAVELGPAQVIKELSLARLRGRGGGGFPTGRKWSGVRQASGSHKYVVANGAEGEPGTFKDRALMRRHPYQVIEGLAIAAFSIGAREAYLALKASFEPELVALTRALAEMQEAGLAGEVPIHLALGPDEYLFGEEKALLEVIEGKAPLPRLFPPYERGLFATETQMGWESTGNRAGHTGPHQANPTLVNNVETLSNVPHVLRHGADWFRSMGTTESPGTVVVTVVGDVTYPDVAEVEMGTLLTHVIEHVGGGVAPGRQVKAVFSGVANAVITAEHLDTPLTYEAFTEIGSGLGAAGFIVFDDSACMVEAARLISRFLFVESCGQCPACKFGTGEITEELTRIEGGAGTELGVGVIGARLKTVTDGNRCYLPVEEQLAVGSLLRAFPEEFAAHLEGLCPRPRPLVLPKVVDLGDGKAVYDERYALKQPDWTYQDDVESA